MPDYYTYLLITHKICKDLAYIILDMHSMFAKEYEETFKMHKHLFSNLVTCTQMVVYYSYITHEKNRFTQFPRAQTHILVFYI
jgi:hypothetical protein